MLLAVLGSILITLQWSDSEFEQGTDWYQMVWSGEKVGYLKRQRLVQPNQLQIRNETQIKTINQGVDFGFEELELLTFSADESKQLLSIHYRFESPHQFIETKLKRVNNDMVGVQRLNHKTYPIKRTDVSYTLHEHLSIQRWIQANPKQQSKLETISLDSSKAEFESIIYVLDNIQDSDNYQVYRQGTEADKSYLIELDDEGTINAYRYSDLFELIRVDDPTVLDISSEKDYYQSYIVKLDKPLGDPYQVKQLTLGLGSAWNVNYLSQSNRQKINSGQLQLDAEASILVASDIITDIEPVVHFNKGTRNRLYDLATRAIGDAITDIEKLTAVRRFVDDYIKDAPRVSEDSIEAILALPEGDCTEHTALFNALVSVLGYKVREVSGLVYLGDDLQAFGGHLWSEVYLNGNWLGIDASWDTNYLTATHIRLNQKNSTEFLRKMRSDKAFELKLIAKD